MAAAAGAVLWRAFGLPSLLSSSFQHLSSWGSIPVVWPVAGGGGGGVVVLGVAGHCDSGLLHYSCLSFSLAEELSVSFTHFPSSLLSLAAWLCVLEK